MLHESGTGGAPKYGVVSQMPVTGHISNPLADHNDTRASDDVAQVGYYQAFLGSGITVELASTERAGFYQYTFPTSNNTKNVIVDVSHVLSSYRGLGLQQSYLGGNIEVVGGGSSDEYYQGYGSYDNVSRCISLSVQDHGITSADSSSGLEPSAGMDCVFLRLLRPSPSVLCNFSGRRKHECRFGRVPGR